MYSIVLMMATCTPTALPDMLADATKEGLIFRRRGSGCEGAQAPAIRTPIRTLFAAVAGARETSNFSRGSGCSGSYSAKAVVTGCSGGGAVVGSTASGTPVMGAGILQRAAVHRQLRVALRQGKMSAEDAASVKQVLDDPNLYDALVTKVHKDISRTIARSPGVGAFGDGHILQLLLDNLPKILDAVKQILLLFGSTDTWRFAPDTKIMPRGPEPQTAWPEMWLAC